MTKNQVTFSISSYFEMWRIYKRQIWHQIRLQREEKNTQKKSCHLTPNPGIYMLSAIRTVECVEINGIYKIFLHIMWLVHINRIAIQFSREVTHTHTAYTPHTFNGYWLHHTFRFWPHYPDICVLLDFKFTSIFLFDT